MGCMSRCAKYFLCFFNFVFFLAGGAALTVGIWLLADRISFTNLFEKMDGGDILTNTDADVIKMIAYILIVAGALTFIVSFLGYCGAMFESRCLLCVYGILIVIVLILECVVVGLAFGLKGDAENVTKDFLKSTIKKYYASNEAKTEAVTAAWDGAMIQLKCCGVESYIDFQNVNWASPGQKAPEACCKRREDGTTEDSACRFTPSQSNSYFQTGCYEAFSQAIETNIGIVIGVGVSLLFIELLVTILALYLACCYWRPQHVYRCVEPPGNEKTHGNKRMRDD